MKYPLEVVQLGLPHDMKKTHLYPTATEFLSYPESGVDYPLDVSLHASVEVFKHGGASGQHNVAVQRPSYVDGAVLDHVVHHFTDRYCELRVCELLNVQ